MIKNITKNRVLTYKHQDCKHIWQKARGLMFRFKPIAMLFTFSREKLVSLHMFFVFFPIDVLYLDKTKQIVEIAENFKPWTTYTPKAKAKYIIELPAGTVKKTNTKLNDICEF